MHLPDSFILTLAHSFSSSITIFFSFYLLSHISQRHFVRSTQTFECYSCILHLRDMLKYSQWKKYNVRLRVSHIHISKLKRGLAMHLPDSFILSIFTVTPHMYLPDSFILHLHILFLSLLLFSSHSAHC